MEEKNRNSFIFNFNMKRFIVHIGIFLAVVGLSCYVVLYQADGATDAFYVKFTSPKQQSLIIGSSRAAQGLHPKVINQNLPNAHIYNYAFSRVHTPYGKPYLESIKEKLETNTTNGIFIVEVNPWSISSKKGEELDDENFSENASYLGKVKNVTAKPNLTYLLNFYGGRNVEIITKKGTNYHGETLFVHDDGWFEVSLKDTEQKNKNRIKSTLGSYKKIREEYKGISDVRLDYLEQTIRFLKKHGDVFLLRLPIDTRMMRIEDTLIPDFDVQMEILANKTEVKYLNLIPKNRDYHYNDGHHLNIQDGRLLSKSIADSIQYYKK